MRGPIDSGAAGFGARLRMLRQQRGWSLRTLAKISYVGKSFISELEHEFKTPGVDTARALDQALGADGALEALVNTPSRATIGAVNRREMLAVAGGMAGSAALAALATALTSYGAQSQRGRKLGDEPDLAAAVALAKRGYQAGEYRQVSENLPRLLETMSTAVDASGSHQVQVLAADAYQTACSIAVKFSDAGLAMVAADRSMAAAERSGDPVAIGASARALTHALASSGHHERAVAVALQAAQRLDRAGGLSMKSGLAVYGALLLRAAVVAATGGQREAASAALDEAHDAAIRLRGDDNAYWTYFCPPNVQLHRVSVAVDLGDVGQAIDYASHINPGTLGLAERKACLNVDVARAYLQWGKYEKAYDALAAAEQVAPQEVVARPLVRSIVAELERRCPPSIKGPVRQLAHRVEVWR